MNAVHDKDRVLVYHLPPANSARGGLMSDTHKRIDELEQRIRALEARPYISISPSSPANPTYPYPTYPAYPSNTAGLQQCTRCGTWYSGLHACWHVGIVPTVIS